MIHLNFRREKRIFKGSEVVSKGIVGSLADKIFDLWNMNDFKYDLEHDNKIKLNFHVERDAGPEVDFIIIENETRFASNLELPKCLLS